MLGVSPPCHRYRSVASAVWPGSGSITSCTSQGDTHAAIRQPPCSTRRGLDYFGGTLSECTRSMPWVQMSCKGVMWKIFVVEFAAIGGGGSAAPRPQPRVEGRGGFAPVTLRYPPNEDVIKYNHRLVDTTKRR